MSHHYYFDLIPFDPLDPMVNSNTKVELPIDWDDFAHQLQILCPTGEIHTNTADSGKHIRFYIYDERQDPWVMVNVIDEHSVIQVSLWPKRLAKEIILWYRQYVPASYPLFCVIEEFGDVTELTADLTSDDIEKLYPFPVSDD
ncbi:MAG: hypothetical protein ABI690_36655 [Chloroflexota bacterium]